MSDAPAVIYLEADDEVTSVVRRIRAAEAGRVVVVAPGRSRATSSAVALRLLAMSAESAGRDVAIVGDALTRSLAAEAGLSAFGTLDDAQSLGRGGVPGDETPPAPVQAPIRVVRGADTTTVEPVVSAEDATVPIRVVPASGVRARDTTRPRLTAVGVVVGLALAIVAATVAAATVLPAATVTLEPATVEVGPRPYVVEVTDPERLTGTVEADATVTATGSFELLKPAVGVVELLNFSSTDQAVAAGTLVAAGNQAFETTEDVVVPRGRLTPDGRISSGSASVGVVAAAPGPDANVPAGAIDTVLSQGVDARLRQFPENGARLVSNAEPTTGGVDESGTEITEADVDAAVAALRADLRAQVADAVAAAGDGSAVESELAEPEIAGLKGLVGTHDAREARIHGTLAWEAFAFDPAHVEEAARDQMLADPGGVPAGHELLADSIRVDAQEANLGGPVLRVDVTVTGLAVRAVDREEVLERIVGRDAIDARAALADIGSATVDLWPGWVGSVPDSEWRVDVVIVTP